MSTLCNSHSCFYHISLKRLYHHKSINIVRWVRIRVIRVITIVCVICLCWLSENWGNLLNLNHKLCGKYWCIHPAKPELHVAGCCCPSLQQASINWRISVSCNEYYRVVECSTFIQVRHGCLTMSGTANVIIERHFLWIHFSSFTLRNVAIDPNIFWVVRPILCYPSNV